MQEDVPTLESIMVAKGRQNGTGSAKVEVGEIDTSAPFQSVKDAVTLFGEGAFSGEKPAIKKSKAYSPEMAEAAKRAVEGELRRWREREQKKAAEAASRILAEAQMSTESSPQHYRLQKPNPPEKIQVHKLEKERSSISKKVLLPNISGIFNRKKNQIEGGSPSYLPGENPF
ncbi:hypothetical protein GOBAR_AA30887 [Gossypium barbadense]|uniref:Uncharacterized protein n=1 Tax=Gossypium barbadense TaxID=3634 RepID=A0A2P5WFC9_GOSBA|nr:hypothetical protein GOBAR_AA30887 [Gossypium barbadense]